MKLLLQDGASHSASLTEYIIKASGKSYKVISVFLVFNNQGAES